MPFWREPVVHPQSGELVTKQSFRDDCNIVSIVNRYGRSGQFDHVNPRQPLYGDFREAGDLMAAQERVAAALDEFMLLPPKVRRFCDGKPERFLELLADPSGAAELAELGLELELREDAPEEWLEAFEDARSEERSSSQAAPPGAPAERPEGAEAPPGAPSPRGEAPTGTAVGEG